MGVATMTASTLLEDATVQAANQPLASPLKLEFEDFARKVTLTLRKLIAAEDFMDSTLITVCENVCAYADYLRTERKKHLTFAKWFMKVRVPKQSYLVQSALHVAAPIWYQTTLGKVIADKSKFVPKVISTLVSSDPRTIESLSKEPGLYRLIGSTAKGMRSTVAQFPLEKLWRKHRECLELLYSRRS